MKNAVVLFRCTKEEKMELRKDAEKHNKKVSAFIRWLIDKQKKEDEGK